MLSQESLFFSWYFHPLKIFAIEEKVETWDEIEHSKMGRERVFLSNGDWMIMLSPSGESNGYLILISAF